MHRTGWEVDRERAEIYGENVRKARERRRIKQETLAGELGVSKSHMSKMESGVRVFTDSMKIRTAQALEIKVGTLFPIRALQEIAERG
jgi:transcriptional regulator with XRE-family HTH domain